MPDIRLFSISGIQSDMKPNIRPEIGRKSVKISGFAGYLARYPTNFNIRSDILAKGRISGNRISGQFNIRSIPNIHPTLRCAVASEYIISRPGHFKFTKARKKNWISHFNTLTRSFYLDL